MNNAQMSARVGLFFLMGIALIWVTCIVLGRRIETKQQGSAT